MKNTHKLLLTLISGLLLAFSWPESGFAPFLLIAFIPLLFIEDELSQQKQKATFFKMLGFAYLTFLIWNGITISWIYKASNFGAVFTILINTLFMALVFAFFHVSKKRFEGIRYYFILPVYWLAYEYIHHNWELDYPWLVLGNGFAAYYKLIQWYEYCGSMGGSLWILITNILGFLLFKSVFNKEKRITNKTIAFILVAILPIISSLVIYYTYHEESKPVNVVVVQPNIDPYNEKFSNMSAMEQLQRFLELGNNKIDSTTQYLVGPETALVENIWDGEIKNSQSYNIIKLFLKRYHKLSVVVGVSDYKMYTDSTHLTTTARPYNPVKGYYYDAFNSAIQVDNKDSLQLYHKSKLVIGVERIPFSFIFKHFESFAIDLGGTVGSLGTQPERGVFQSSYNSTKVAPVICYESVYGEYVSNYVKKGANIIFIITNDGWWGETAGHRQHFNYARLRAIENRRSIARSANTGISAFFNQRGDALDRTKWWTPTAIKGTINANDKVTIYTQYGDYLGRFAIIIATLIIITMIIFKYIIKKI